MIENTKCIEVRKDYYLLVVNDVSLGEFEKSDLRHIIEVIDNSIQKKMILKELSNHDKQWREIACNITKGDKDLADDLTQQMYLKLMNYKKFNVYFVFL